MKLPRGFGKNYFSLSAIQACVSQTQLDATSVRVKSDHSFMSIDFDTEELEDEALLPIDINPVLILSSKTCHCNCHFKHYTRNHLRENAEVNLNISPYEFSNSNISPPT